MNNKFSIGKDHLPKAGLTISTKSGIESETLITYFSLGKYTDISPESYDKKILYLGCLGKGEFYNDYMNSTLEVGDFLWIEKNTLCGMKTDDGLVYTEIIQGKDLNMNKALKAGEVTNLRDLVPYEKESIVNMDVASNDKMKFIVMSFDEGTGLSPHKAPGDALVFALEGRAVIGYEGKEYEITAGENFRFEKNSLHSVTAKGKFKMALLLVLE